MRRDCRLAVAAGVLFLVLWYWQWNSLDASRIRPARPVVWKGSQTANFRIVTAFSINHFNEALTSCSSLTLLPEVANLRPGFFIVYLLENLTQASVQDYRQLCPIAEIRTFNFSLYPTFVTHLTEYRWKFLILQEVLRETNDVFWIDTSVKFRRIPGKIIQDFFAEMKTTFNQCGFRLMEDTGHSIFAATHPDMLSAFKFPLATAKETRMRGASDFVIQKSSASMTILDAMVNCSLSENCMAPPGNALFCEYAKLAANEYAGCHRFDQSALSIQLAKCASNGSSYFRSTDQVVVARGE